MKDESKSKGEIKAGSEHMIWGAWGCQALHPIYLDKIQ